MLKVYLKFERDFLLEFDSKVELKPELEFDRRFEFKVDLKFKLIRSDKILKKNYFRPPLDRELKLKQKSSLDLVPA